MGNRLIQTAGTATIRILFQPPLPLFDPGTGKALINDKFSPGQGLFHSAIDCRNWCRIIPVPGAALWYKDHILTKLTVFGGENVMWNKIAIGFRGVAEIAIDKTTNQHMTAIRQYRVGDTVGHRRPGIAVLLLRAQFHHIPAEIRYPGIEFVSRLFVQRKQVTRAPIEFHAVIPQNSG